MLQISGNAIRQLRKMAARSKSENAGIRIFVDGGGCCGPKYRIDVSDTGNKEDKVIQKDGLTIYLEQWASKYLSKATLDYTKTDGESAFSISGTNPCSCR